MADGNTAVYAVVDMSKKRKKLSPSEKQIESPLYDVAERDVDTVPIPEKNEGLDSNNYSMVSLDNMYSTLATARPARATAEINTGSSEANVKKIQKKRLKMSSLKNGSSSHSCILIITAAVAITAALVCIAILFAEIAKLKTQTVPLQQSPLGQQIADHSSAILQLQEVNGSLWSVVTLFMQENMKLTMEQIQQLNSSVNTYFEQLDQQLQSVSTNISQLDMQVYNISSTALPTLQCQIGELQNVSEFTRDALRKQLGYCDCYPASSCASLHSYSSSGDYWVRASNGSAVRVYCDTTRSCGGVTGGWMRVAKLNATEGCPSGLAPNGSRCRIISNLATCSPVIAFDTTHEYSKVCGKIIASPGGRGTNDGFRSQESLTGNYVDGVSLTHNNREQHIWTFAASYSVPCSCNTTDIRNPPPPIVGNDYFCDRGSVLWNGNGEGCSASNRYNSCCSFNNPPWFYKQLPQPTTDDIEMRVCRNQDREDEDIEIHSIEIYVQ